MSVETRKKHQEEVIGWFPTPAQFEAYLTREVEMARANLVRPGANPQNCLHSHETCVRTGLYAKSL